MYSTLTATRDGSAQEFARGPAATVQHSGSNSVSDFVAAASQTHGDTSFGASTDRFETQNKEIRKQHVLPGPSNYYSFGAGNYSPGQRIPNNHVFNDSRALDGQWNNRSQSTKYGQVLNAM